LALAVTLTPALLRASTAGTAPPSMDTPATTMAVVLAW
jgi:hypothetical protein